LHFKKESGPGLQAKPWNINQAGFPFGSDIAFAPIILAAIVFAC